jgi:hypothetical protein
MRSTARVRGRPVCVSTLAGGAPPLNHVPEGGTSIDPLEQGRVYPALEPLGGGLLQGGSLLPQRRCLRLLAAAFRATQHLRQLQQARAQRLAHLHPRQAPPVSALSRIARHGMAIQLEWHPLVATGAV